MLRGPRTPAWSCRCGGLDNWASRLRCRICQRPAAASIQARAKKAHEEAKQKGTMPGKPRMALRGIGQADELEKERKRRRELEAEIKKAKAGLVLREAEEEDVLPSELQVREKHLQALTRDLGKEYPIVEALRAEVEAKRCELRESRPLGVRQKALAARVNRLEDGQAKDLAKQHEIEAEVEAARKKLVEHNDRMAKNKEVLAKAQEELAQVKVEASAQDQAKVPEPEFWHMLSESERGEERW